MRKTLSKLCVLSGLLFLASSITSVNALDVTKKMRNAIHTTQNNKNQVSNQLEPTEAEAMHPFEKASNNISNENVIGLIADQNKIYLLSNEQTYTVANTKDTLFSDIDSFRKYKNLFSIVLRNAQLTNEVLSNLRKYMSNEIKSIAIENCTIDDVELLASIIAEHPNLESITIKQYTMNAKDAHLILKAVNHPENLKFINLGLGSVSDEDCSNLAEILTSAKDSLTDLYLSWINTETSNYQGMISMMDSIKSITNLTEFEFSVMNLPQDCSSYVFKTIGDLELLTDLKLYIGNLSSYNETKLFEDTEVLRESLKNLKNLVKLDISQSNWPAELMLLISEALQHGQHNLQILNLSYNAISAKTAEALSKAMSDSHKLTALFVNNCELSDQAFSTICKGLEKGSIEHLYVRNNQIKGDALKNLPFKAMNNLVVLDLSNNDIDFKNAYALMQATSSHPTLYVVNFTGNKRLEDITGAERTNNNDQVAQWKQENNTKVLFLGV